MAFDGLFIYSVIDELKNKLTGGKVDKINQPEKDEIILTIRNNKNTYRLLISASAVYPKIHITSVNRQNPINAPMFCMVLRKYLQSSRIISIKQLSTDRVIIIDFQSPDDLGYESIYSLFIEIMGRHSNITLIRKSDNIIMDSIKHVTPDINTIRCLYPGIKFIYPPSSQKMDPFDFEFEEFYKNIMSMKDSIDEKLFLKLFTGVSKPLSKEMYTILNVKDIEINYENCKIMYDKLLKFFNIFKSKNFSYTAYIYNNSFKDFYCIDLNIFNKYKAKKYNSPSELAEEFYYKKDTSDRLNSKSMNIQKLLNTNIERCSKKLNILQKSLKKCKDKDSYKLCGELLTANIYMIKKGQKSIEVENYYENGSHVNIKLNENKTPSENVQYYYKKYNKLKRTEKEASLQLENTQKEIEYLQSVLSSIESCENYEDIEEIKNELMETGYIKFKKNAKKKKEIKSKPIHKVSSEGIDIYIGKNNFQNDYLTLHFANKHDIWMHVKKVPGSHVIVKFKDKILQKTLEEAALFAAHYSKASSSSKVAVDYTEVKNVHKPNGAKPGMVIYYTNKTMYVNPQTIDD